MKVIAFLAMLLGGCAMFVPAHAVEVPWTDYFGAHYEQRPWGKSVRDPGGPGRFGYRTPGSRQPPAKWSGQGEPNELKPFLARGPVLLNVGGLGSGRDDVQTRNFLDGVRRDGGATWKRELASRVKRVADLPGASERVYWQFGNEINGPRFLRNVVSWAGNAGRDREAALQKFIPLYVEYFLAPGVEAVRGVSQELHGDSQRIRVMLGSLANARDPHAIRFYEALLNYSIKGSHAPTLAGRKVHEVVHALSIHYLVSAEDRGWTAMLDQLADNWMGKGGIRAIWSTEEIGVRRAQSGYGGATALAVTARYLDWWSARGWDASRGHCFFWGSEMGPGGARAEDALNTLLDFTGHVPLRRLPAADAGGLENYQFRAGRDDKRVLIALAGSGESSSLATVLIPVAGWSGTPRVRTLLYTPQGSRPLQVSIQRVNNEFQVSLRDPYRLARGEAIMLLLERN
jgi:hypothetical protein